MWQGEEEEDTHLPKFLAAVHKSDLKGLPKIAPEKEICCKNPPSAKKLKVPIKTILSYTFCKAKLESLFSIVGLGSVLLLHTASI